MELDDTYLGARGKSLVPQSAPSIASRLHLFPMAAMHVDIRPLPPSSWVGVWFQVTLGLLVSSAMAVSLNAIRPSHRPLLRVIYPQGAEESELPRCQKWAVCNRVDTYSMPWVERLCTCSNGQECPSTVDQNDGHTVADRSRQYKVCEAIDSLPVCRFFRDVTWTYVTSPDNRSQQLVQCVCPENSTPYISGHGAEETADGTVYKYYFSCSPESSLRCRRKEPCRLFTVRKRFPVEEVTTSTLCRCPSKTSCPRRHTDPYVIAGDSNVHDEGRIYSGFCGTNV